MKEKVVHTVCPLGGDHTFCILKVWVKEGKIQKVESTDLPQCADDRCVSAPGGYLAIDWSTTPTGAEISAQKSRSKGGT